MQVILQYLEYAFLLGILYAQLKACATVINRTKSISNFVPDARKLSLDKVLTPEAKERKMKEEAERKRLEEEKKLRELTD